MRSWQGAVCAFGAAGLLSSCAVTGHLDEALALKAYSDEQAAMHADVAAADARFERLLLRVQDGAVFTGRDAGAFRQEFGAPVLVRQMMRAGREAEAWLYRRAIDHGGARVYVFFDDARKVDAVALEEGIKVK